MRKAYSVGYGEGELDPLEYLVKLNPRGVALEDNLQALSSSGQHSKFRRSGSWRPSTLTGAESAAVLQGLGHGPRDVAVYRTHYSLPALRQLERSLTFAAASMAVREQWRMRKTKTLIREIAVLAISEKYFNICTVCQGTTWKKDRTRCRSCNGGIARRSQRECAAFLGMDHKNYARLWESRVMRLEQLLDEWEEEVRRAIRRQLVSDPLSA